MPLQNLGMVQITFTLCPLFSVKVQSTKARFLNFAKE